MGERIYIDRDWTYAGEFSADMVFHPMTGGEKVSLPHSTAITPLHYFDEHIYQKVAGYQRIIFGEEAFAGKDVYITFEGAAHEATVYLNGKELFVHRNGYTAFTILLSDLKIGEDNLLTVKLDDVELVLLGDGHNVANAGVDEHAYALAFCGEIAWHLGHITAAFWPEDKAHPVDAEGLYLADVIGIAHTTHLYYWTIYHLTI